MKCFICKIYDYELHIHTRVCSRNFQGIREREQSQGEMLAIWMKNLRLQARSAMKLDLYSWERERIYKSLIHECDSNSPLIELHNSGQLRMKMSG